MYKRQPFFIAAERNGTGAGNNDCADVYKRQVYALRSALRAYARTGASSLPAYWPRPYVPAVLPRPDMTPPEAAIV